MDRKKHILLTVEDLVGAFLYYDRQEDEDLLLGEIENAIIKGEITAYEIKAQFCKSLDERLKTANPS